MATYKRGTRFGVLSFTRIVDNITLADFQANPTLTPQSITDIKNKYLYREDCQSVILITGDAFKYYLPLTRDNFDVDIEGFQIDILNQNFETVSSAVGTVQAGTYDTGKYYYLEFTTPAINQDKCILAIVDQNSSNRLYYISNYIDFLNTSYQTDYPFFKFRNSYNHFGHFWEEIITDISTFYNQYRLDVNMIDAKYQFEIEQEKESLTGEIIDIVNDQDKYIIIETYQFTDEMHDGFSVFVGSDTIFINDQQYVKKSGYERETPSLLNLTKGRVELYDLDYATANKSMSV